MFVEVPTTGAAYMAMWTTEKSVCYPRLPRGRQAGGQSSALVDSWSTTPVQGRWQISGAWHFRIHICEEVQYICK
eukprot:6848583-Heterocapsa_arctica.AAC.1